jgi:hypothetical protein
MAETGPRPGPAWPVSSVMPPLAALPTAPSAVRAHVRAMLAMWRMSGLTDALELVVSELVVSELVANGVNASADADGSPRYAEGRMPVIRLCLLTDGKRLVAEVWDQAPGVPVRLSASRDDENGRGLDLVDMITGSRWGWRPAMSRPGKCVWAVFEVPEVSRWLGHKSIEVTHQIYGHLVPSSFDRARTALDAAYLKSQKQRRPGN